MFHQLSSAMGIYKRAFNKSRPIIKEEVSDILDLVFDNLQIQPSRFPAAFGPFGLTPLFGFLLDFYDGLIWWKEASGEADFDNQLFQTVLTRILVWVTGLTDKVLGFRVTVNRDVFDPPVVVVLRGLMDSHKSDVPVSDGWSSLYDCLSSQ
jgi:hypothetical protein